MIKGLGTDVVEVDRVRQTYLRHGDKFARRILSETEFAEFATFPLVRKGEYLAGRFAAKEAIAKAPGIGLAKLHMPSVSVVRTDTGMGVVWSGQASSHHEGHWHISITHTATIAFAVAIWET